MAVWFDVTPDRMVEHLNTQHEFGLSTSMVDLVGNATLDLLDALMRRVMELEQRVGELEQRSACT